MQDFLSIDLGTTDVILGVKWLETLGDVTSNHHSLQLSFMLNGSKVVLQGDPSLVRSQVTLKSLIKALKLEKQGFLVELYMLQQLPSKEEGFWDEVPSEIRGVLEAHAFVFQPLPGLPSNRELDHAIELVLGTVSVNVRPYRYP